MGKIAKVSLKIIKNLIAKPETWYNNVNQQLIEFNTSSIHTIYDMKK